MTGNDFLIERELAPGERLLWRGSPKAGVKFDADYIAGVIFFLVWTAASCFFEYLAFTQKFAGGPENNYFAAVLFAPFLAFGLYKVVVSLINVPKIRTIEYALTDRRALISGPNPGDAVSIDRETARVRLDESSDGTGTIYFLSSLGVANPQLAFKKIDNAKSVYGMILGVEAPVGASGPVPQNDRGYIAPSLRSQLPGLVDFIAVAVALFLISKWYREELGVWLLPIGLALASAPAIVRALVRRPIIKTIPMSFNRKYDYLAGGVVLVMTAITLLITVPLSVALTSFVIFVGSIILWRFLR